MATTVREAPAANRATLIQVEAVRCPDCGGDDAVVIAQGPDYDEHRCGDQEFALVRCNCCEVYYLNPRPTPAMLPVIYGAGDYYAYRFADDANSIVLRARDARNRAKVARLLQDSGLQPSTTRVLEIGPGDGALLRSFHQAGVPAANVFGIDFEARAVQLIERMGFRGILGRIEETDLEPHSFDVILMIQVIEHVVDPRGVVRAIHRLLRPGGVFLVETPNMGSWDRRFFRRKTWGGYHFPRHFTLWTPQTLGRMLAEAGFSVESVTTPNSAVLLSWSLRHVVEALGLGRRAISFFSDKNPLVLGALFAIDLLPSMLGCSANMRVLARTTSR